MSLVFRNVSKRFGSVIATDDVSLTFEPGLIYGIIGPNGAGKSTLINMAAGSYTVTSGEILLDGMPVHTLKKYQISLAGIARTYQNIRLFEQMSVIDNLEVCLYPRDVNGVWKEIFIPGYAKARQAGRLDHCRALLEQFALADVADLDANSLPYGRQRMLEIARALVRKPRVLLLDEPAAGLNHGETLELKKRLAALRRPDLILIVVEHDMDLVMTLCDRVIVLHHGALLAQGTPAEVQANEQVQQAYLGTVDDIESIRAVAQSRKAERGLRVNADPVRH
ncbi:ABC transporter ATP-binding protein [Rhodoligotrophos defluvii]|uniref:ABC transporter ATP-binding protein n=1 Tax=Rhodoligotrophos defluvii TaxID=2561934 RepID=UPI0010CA12B2|nr:ABC transporter ATP-binding protein [Rhodoligotrophos defluvii]